MSSFSCFGNPARTALLLGAIAGAAGWNSASAQGVGAAPPTPAAATQPGSGLEEIVVTANKREENLQSVPIAIDAFTANQLENSGVSSTDALSTAVPGLTMESGANGLQPHLRGVGTTATSIGQENSIATYIDGVYIESLTGALMSLNGIKAIEVDKGPQGTLFGRNATGGVISVVTKDPSPDFGGTASVSYGNYNTVATNDYITGGITSGLAADLALHYSDQGEGYGRNLYNGQGAEKTRDFAARSKWLFTPQNDDRLMLSFDYSQTHSTDVNVFEPLPGYPTNWGPGAPAPHGQPFLFTGGPWDIDVPSSPEFSDQQGGVSLQYEHNFGFAKFTNITAYRQDEVNEFFFAEPLPTNAEHASWIAMERQYSEELRLTSAYTSTIKWVGGLYYLGASAGRVPETLSGAVIGAPVQGINFHSVEGTDSEAVYGQATAPLPALSNTNLTLGLRYSVERRSLRGDEYIDFLPVTDIPPKISLVTDAHKIFEKPTWRLALDHHFADDLLGYVSYNRGFKSGVYNTLPPGGATATPVQPEVLDAYEIGVKSEFLDHRVRVNASGFYYNYTDIQVTTYVLGSTVLGNGAKARIYGLDLDLEAKVTDELTISAAVETLHDYFASFPNAQYFYPQSLTEGGGTRSVDASATGNQLPYTPDVSFDISANYAVPIGYGTANFNVTYSHSAGWYASPDNLLKSPTSNLINAQAGWSLPDKRTRITLWGKNLKNQAVPAALVELANPGGYDAGFNLPPRTYGITLQYDF
jgi:iron complex outermembrane receptor protein